MQIIKRRWSRIKWGVPTWYLFVAWLVWIMHSLLVKRKPLLVQPRFFVLNDEARGEVSRLLREEMERMGYAAYGDDNIGVYWRQEHED